MTDTLRFTDLPRRPTTAELDKIMEDVSAQTGEQWTAEKTGAYWLIYHTVDGEKKLHRSRRMFITALSDATGRTIINAITL